MQEMSQSFPCDAGTEPHSHVQVASQVYPFILMQEMSQGPQKEWGS